MLYHNRTFAPLALILLVVCTGSSEANDSTATLGTGGLVLTQSSDISMEQEKLFLSPDEIRVDYIFRNSSKTDITTRVAFPMPIVPFGPMDNVELPDEHKENFVDFTVKVDGQTVATEREQRAISAPVDDADTAKFPEGTDITQAVHSAGLPFNANLSSWKKTLKDLTPETRKKLVRSGLLYGDTNDAAVDDLSPQWSLKETYHWKQTFPAMKSIAVSHRYKPVVGTSLFTGDESDLSTIKSEFEKPYCLDQAGLAGVKRLLGAAKRANSQNQNETYLFAREIEYILTTGANWKGAIGDLTMTLDKVSPNAVLSTCVNGIKKISPTRFEVHNSQFTPQNDVRFIVFQLSPAN